MNLNKYFTFEGRINRAKYFFTLLFLGILLILFSLVAGYIESNILLILLIALVCYNKVCIIVQRLHDIERPGFHYFLLYIPIYNIYLGILLLFIQGTNGPNKYGDDPLQTHSEEVE
ncbi:DUF805 domain-containing protein [Wukongibacter baidiensis]|uniref:DUF805 domain-containing protein n=1 Tax=Wukongibacter baidiensis TaxID=1723361 RepID=UPI003D7F6A80